MGKKLITLATLVCLIAVPISSWAGLSYTKIFESAFGDQKVASFTVTFDSSYPTGGESMTPGNLGYSGFNAVIPEGDLNSGHIPVYDHSNQKLKVMSTSNAEVGNTTDLSNVAVRVFIIGW